MKAEKSISMTKQSKERSIKLLLKKLLPVFYSINIKQMPSTIKELESTFRDDFTIADHFGIKWIVDTYKRAFRGRSNNIYFVTELALVMNWKCWYRYEQGNMEYYKLYEKLRFEIDTRCMDNLKWKDRDYYLKTTD